jgi:transcription initiation factor IIF auxiliary subunit
MKPLETYSVALNEETQTIEELIQSLSALSTHMKEDNDITKSRGEPYPTAIRQMQMVSINALVDAINETHKKLDTIQMGDQVADLSDKERMFQSFVNHVDSTFDPSQN